MTLITNESEGSSARARRRGLRIAVAGCAALALGAAMLPALRRVQLERAEHVAMAELQCPAGMRPIPGGSFALRDQSDTTLPAFCLDAAEVTLGDYRRCVMEGSCKPPEDAGDACNWNHPERAQHPVNCVTAEDAGRYCAWAGKTLPNEAQWEYAARGGFRALAYPWGDQEPGANSACWSPRGERRSTCEVASFHATTFGLHDMAGNVSEWVSAETSDGERAKTAQQPHRTSHCSRGGSWMVGDPMLLHSVICIERERNERGANLGMRCAAVAAQP